MFLYRGPRKRLDGGMAVATAITENVRQARCASGGLVVPFLGATAQEQGRVGPRMPIKEASEFEAGIAGRAEQRGFKFANHQIFFFQSLQSLRAPHFRG